MKMRLAFLIILLFSSILCTSCDKETERFPITLSEGGLILLDIRVADSINTRFILDTGAGIHVVSNSLLRRVVSNPQGRFTAFRHTGERIDLDVFEIEALSIGRFRQEKPIVAMWSLLDSFKIDGILSLKFFVDHPFTLDLRDTALIFETARSLSDRANGGRFVPINVADIRGKSIDVFAEFCVSDTLKLECIIDTGSPGGVIDSRYLVPLGVDTSSSTIQRRVRKSLFGDLEIEYIATIPALSLCDVPNSVVRKQRIVFKRGMIYDGLVGGDFFTGRRVTFDIPGRRFAVDTGEN